MARLKDINWNCGEEDADGKFVSVPSVEHAQLATLQDIRDELKKLNRVFACPNFLEMPSHLRATRIAIQGLRRDQAKRRLRKSAKSAGQGKVSP